MHTIVLRKLVNYNSSDSPRNALHSNINDINVDTLLNDKELYFIVVEK